MHDDQDTLRGLLRKRAHVGRLDWIGLRPARAATMCVVSEAEALTERGIAGDHTSARGSKKRQVSLIQAEHLSVIAMLAGRSAVEPELLRRNLVVSGINLLALRSTKFRIGGVLFAGEATCDPCAKMERALGLGGYTAMRGHGGILARVIEGGILRVGDEVDFLEP
jgi:MOSC domain-containing protein YiiM